MRVVETHDQQPIMVEYMIIPEVEVCETNDCSPKDTTIMETQLVKYIEPDPTQLEDSMDSYFVDNTQQSLEVRRTNQENIHEYMKFLKSSCANMVKVEEDGALTQKDNDDHNHSDGFQLVTSRSKRKQMRKTNTKRNSYITKSKVGDATPSP